MNREQLYEFCIAEEKACFGGWDFSHINGRMITDELPWSYRSLVKERLNKNKVLLDMGTGGGELLSTFAPLPERTYATESYQPNITIARRRLEPLGVEVSEIDSDEDLLFSDKMFDLVISSHESYNVKELKRILRSGGEFLTQQVGCSNLSELTAIMGLNYDPDIVHWDMEYAVNELESAGFGVTYAEEYFPETRFYDVGAVVYLAKAVPWQFSGFSVDCCFDGLCDIHDHIEKHGFYSTKAHRFIITAFK